VESFKFSREWLRGEAARVTEATMSNVTRKFNLPPSYVLIHRVSTAGIGVLCQLECEGEFRAEVIRWIPGYLDPASALPTERYAATSVLSDLRGRPRGRLRGTIVPRMSSSPPQTPQGSLRSSAPVRQAILARQPRHIAFASSTSLGDSAKNSSGSSVHGRSSPPGRAGSAEASIT